MNVLQGVKALSFVIVSLVFVPLILIPKAGAQSQFQEDITAASIAVTPAIIDSPVAPGQSSTRKIQITNNNAVAIPLSVQVSGAVIEGQQLDGFSDERYDVSEWLRFEEEAYIFEAGQTRTLGFTITVPLTANPGGHYAQIILRSLSIQQDSNVNSIVLPEVGVPVLVTVPGQLTEESSIRRNAFAPHTVLRGSPLQSTLTIENTGTVHNLTTTRFEVLDDGEVLNTFKPTPMIVLPGTSRDSIVNWSIEQYGSYELRAVASYGSDQQVFISHTQTIYVIPPLNQLALVWFISWIILYIIRHRTNVGSAWQTLVRGGAD